MIGKYTYGNIKVIGSGEIKIGNFCSIASGVQAVMVGHNPYFVSTYPFNSKYFSKSWPEVQLIPGHPVQYHLTIGNDVWIGQNVLFVGNCKISDGAIISAGSVVRGDVEPYSIVIGNPAKLIKKRFSPENIGWLLLIRWWDWPESKIRKYCHLLCQNRIDDFIEVGKREEKIENAKPI